MEHVDGRRQEVDCKRVQAPGIRSNTRASLRCQVLESMGIVADDELYEYYPHVACAQRLNVVRIYLRSEMVRKYCMDNIKLYSTSAPNLS